MIHERTRRRFLGGLAGLPLAAGVARGPRAGTEPGPVIAPPTYPPLRRGEGPLYAGMGPALALEPSIKLSCNFYSFNEPLQGGAMTLEGALSFCAGLGFDAVDITGYYFPGYPEPPADGYVYEVKKQAFRLGLDISGTGVRNDFTRADVSRREADVALVKRWIEVASRLGAPVLRVFAGPGSAKGHSRKEVTGWLVESLRSCVAHGEQHGVIVVLQNHDDFLKTAEDVLAVREQIGSDWLGLNVDIGSLRTGDPYAEIARLAPHADTWQIKEHVYRAGVEEKVDLPRVFAVLREAGYRGYAPLEILGPGDPRPRLRRFLDEARRALA
jgi:sugar phosphate isomerase/epimerase